MNLIKTNTMTTPDGRGLHVRRWGNRQCKRRIIVVHGLGEHSGWYVDFAKRSAKRDIATLIYDQHGHGKSPGRRGDAPSFDTLIDDVDVALNEAAQDDPDAERILLGHSMGGSIVLNYLLDRSSEKVSRAIVINPMILPPDPPTRPQAFAAWLTAKLIPRFRLTASIEPEQLTQDADVIEQLADDPLLHDQLSIGLGGHLVAQGHWLLENAHRLKQPLLMLIGKDDELCDERTSRLFADRAARHCERIEFPGLRHNLLLEMSRQVVYDALFNWVEASKLNRQIAKSNASEITNK